MASSKNNEQLTIPEPLGVTISDVLQVKLSTLFIWKTLNRKEYWRFLGTDAWGNGKYAASHDPKCS